MPAIATALIGLFTGDWLRSPRTRRETRTGLLLWGCLTATAGLVLGRWFPINKNLWTSTYVLLSAGLALLLLAAVHELVDIRGRNGWARPFLVFGTNAIVAFFGSTLMAKILYLIHWTEGSETVSLQQWLYRHLFASWLPDYVASLAWALAFLALWWWLMTVLYRRRVLIKI